MFLSVFFYHDHWKKYCKADSSFIVNAAKNEEKDMSQIVNSPVFHKIKPNKETGLLQSNGEYKSLKTKWLLTYFLIK